MYIPKILLSMFCEFVQSQLGCELTSVISSDEYYRFMLGDRLVIIRPIATLEAQQFEVWCGDPHKLRVLEDAWATHWILMLKDSGDGQGTTETISD